MGGHHFEDFMELRDYQYLANKTATDLGFLGDLNHLGLGMSGEAGELADAIKKYTVYHQPLDRDNLREELGDLLWFVALGAKILNEPLEIIARENIAKLQKRYPDQYSDYHAATRLDKL